MERIPGELLNYFFMQPIIVFDFDGVIVLGSERTKQKCWLELFQPKGEKAITALTKALERYSEGRGSRYDVILDVLHGFGVPEEKMAKLVETYSNEYAQKVQSGILTGGIRKEDRRALDFLAQKAVLFINTTTPQLAMEEILDKLNIRHLFKGVYGQGLQGQNSKKTDILRVIAQRASRPIKDIIFIGDGEGDRRAATEAGCRFIGIGNNDNHWVEIEQKFPVVSSVSEATAYLFPDFSQSLHSYLTLLH